MNFVIASLLANLSYALSDNVNGIVAKRNTPLKVAMWAAISAVVIYLIPLVLFFQHEIAKLTISSTLWIAGTGVLVILGYLCFIHGMNKGSIMLTGVIGGSFPAVTTITALLLFREQVNPLQIIAIAVIFMGIVLSSIHGSSKTILADIKASSLLFAVAACLLWGIYFALIRIPVEQVGWFLPQYGSNVIGIPIYLLIAFLTHEPKVTALPRSSTLIALASTLGVGGSMFFNYSISQGPTSVVAPIAGSSPAVFAIIAYFLFKEQLNKFQLTGIIAALAGIIGLTLASS